MTLPLQPDSTPSTDTPAHHSTAIPLGPISDLALLYEIHSQLRNASEETVAGCQASSEILVRHRGEFEGLSEWLRRFESSLRESRNHVDTLGVALDRIKIVALNTGLEGARLGDLAGKALIAVSDELRSLTSRGLELLSDQASTVEQMDLDRQRLIELTDRTQSNLSEIETKLQEALSAEHSCHQAIERFASALEQATGFDAEAAARLGRISEQARGLAESLTSVSKSEHQNAVRHALLPALQPLVDWLSSSVESKP